MQHLLAVRMEQALGLFLTRAYLIVRNLKHFNHFESNGFNVFYR